MSYNPRSAPPDDNVFRGLLSNRLIFVSIVSIVILSIIILAGSLFASWVKSDVSIFNDTAHFLLSTLLPLFATWVGTVLAFYFSRENFAAASSNTLELLRAAGAEKLRSIPITKGMIQRSQMVVFQLPPAGQFTDAKITDVHSMFSRTGANGQRISRLVFLDSSDNFVAVMHRSIWMELLTVGYQRTPPINQVTDPIKTLLETPVQGASGTYERLMRDSVAYVGGSQTLADAKSAMEAVTNCQDVMVTQSGAKGSPVVGWITNADLARLSNA
jgi:hypothetical protein